jgi:peptidoglycan-N-acetylglucosamine deacetylase
MKKNKNILLLLSGVVLFIVFKVCVLDNNITKYDMNNHKDSITVSISNSRQQLIVNENEMAKDKVLSGDKKRKKYMDMYPDMYVDSIKPVILLDEKKIAYLTFDDGPSHITNQILDILDEYDVKATFFVIGSTITEEGENCLKEMVEQGHTIGIHTYSHNYKKLYSSVEAYLEDFYQVYHLIYEATGVKMNIFRFPWGSNNVYNKNIKKELVAEMERRGFTYFDWNVSAEDSVGNPTEYRIKKNVFKDLERYNNPIILMHDAAVNRLTAKTLPDIIEKIMDKGYGFDTLSNREPYQSGK